MASECACCDALDTARVHTLYSSAKRAYSFGVLGVIYSLYRQSIVCSSGFLAQDVSLLLLRVLVDFRLCLSCSPRMSFRGSLNHTVLCDYEMDQRKFRR